MSPSNHQTGIRLIPDPSNASLGQLQEMVSQLLEVARSNSIVLEKQLLQMAKLQAQHDLLQARLDEALRKLQSQDQLQLMQRPLALQERDYRENRARLDPKELRARRGHWVAFSLDGTSIVDSCEDLGELYQRLAAAGKGLQEVVLEHLHDLDTFLGGAELP